MERDVYFALKNKAFIFISHFVDLHKEQEKVTKITIFLVTRFLFISPFAFTFQCTKLSRAFIPGRTQNTFLYRVGQCYYKQVIPSRAVLFQVEQHYYKEVIPSMLFQVRQRYSEELIASRPALILLRFRQVRKKKIQKKLFCLARFWFQSLEPCSKKHVWVFPSVLKR